MKNFKDELINEINGHKNHFNLKYDNSKLINKIKRNFIHYLFPVQLYLSLAGQYGRMRSIFHSMLNDGVSKRLFIRLLAAKLLGKTKYETTADHNEFISKINSCALNHSDLMINNQNVPSLNLAPLGYSVMLNATTEAISDFYHYKLRSNVNIRKDDVLIDIGSGGFGESIVLFSSMLQSGKVLAYPSEKCNLAILKHNINLNPHLSRNIQLKTTIDFNELDRVDVIKIDFWFFDLRLLKIFSKLIRKFHPKLIMKFQNSPHDVITALSLLNKLTKKYIFCLSQNEKGDIYLLASKN